MTVKELLDLLHDDLELKLIPCGDPVNGWQATLESYSCNTLISEQRTTASEAMEAVLREAYDCGVIAKDGGN